MLSPPFTFLAEDSGFRELISFVKQDRVEVQGSVVVREALLESDPLLIEKFLRGTLRGFYFARNDRSGTVPILARIQNIKEDLAAKTYDVARSAMTADGTFNEDAQRKALEIVLERLAVKDAPPLNRVFNYTLAQRINGELNRKGSGAR